MGREWYLNWGTKSSTKKGRTSGGGGDGSGGGSGGRGSYDGGGSRKGERKPSMPPTATATAAAAAAASAGGCMNAVLHLFDFQHFQLCLHPQDNSFLPDDLTPLKGLEAPRNSLESITEDEKDDHLPISVKTNRRDTALKLVQAPRGKIEDLTSESSCSPASARTPNVVARLMGLEILPESNNTTPRSSSSHSQPISSSPHVTSTTSTPPVKTKTPRSSTSTRRRSTDVVDHHRLSLQINKENSIQKQMELSRPSCSAINTKRKDGRNNVVEEEVSKSPRYYARQIMKQVRETVSRRVGVDITNTVNNGARSADHRRDEHLLSSPSTTTSTTKTATKTSKHKKSSKKEHSLSNLSSSSPRFRSNVNDENSNSNNNNNKVVTMSSKSDQLKPSVVTEVPQKTVTSVREEESLKRFHTTATTATTTTTTTTSNSSKRSLMSKKPLKSYESIRNKKDEQFVRPATLTTTTSKKGKRTTLSSDLRHGTVPSLVPFKKDSSTVTSPTKLLIKQEVSSNAQPSKPTTTSTDVSTTTTTQPLSRYPRQRINEQRQEEATHALADRPRKDATIVNTAMEFQYISRILKCTGIDRDTPVSFMRWFLPSHPLDPSIFHNLEAAHYLTTTSDSSCKQLNLAVNRKLIFHLVDEMLADMLKPYVKLKSHYHGRHHHHHHHHHYHNPLYKQDQQINGFQLVKILCTRIRKFPSADCQTLQDIDTLVEKDLPSFGASNNVLTYQEEGEEIVTEIERHIMDSLIQEITCLA